MNHASFFESLKPDYYIKDSELIIPNSKTQVFLREIAERYLNGEQLESLLPELSESDIKKIEKFFSYKGESDFSSDFFIKFEKMYKRYY